MDDLQAKLVQQEAVQLIWDRMRANFRDALVRDEQTDDPVVVTEADVARLCGVPTVDVKRTEDGFGFDVYLRPTHGLQMRVTEIETDRGDNQCAESIADSC